MDKKLTFWGVALFAILYFVAVFAAAFLGFAGPAGWVLFPALAALLAVFSYRWLALRWKRFGLGAVLAGIVAVLCFAMGEMTLPYALVVLGAGLLSDVVAYTGKDWLSYPVLALGNIAWILPLWTKTEWYYSGAVEEMGKEYADALIPMATTGWLCIALVAIVVMAEVGLWISKKCIKNV